jgi:glutamine amidotransferase
MCRHLAYLGPPVTLSSLVLEPAHSRLHQSYAPKHQRSGTMNADGFGVGWWDLDVRPEPARYRRATPMWSDRSLPSIAGMVRAGAVLAAVRSATPPTPVEESGAAPFMAGPWLFSHNGAVDGWCDGVSVAVRRSVSDTRAAGIEGSSDSETLFALVLDRLDDGLAQGAALVAVVRELTERYSARLNFLLGEGTSIAATTWGNSLFIRSGEGGVVVASEPFDDDPAWTPVADGSLVEATAAGIDVTPFRSCDTQTGPGGPRPKRTERA